MSCNGSICFVSWQLAMCFEWFYFFLVCITMLLRYVVLRCFFLVVIYTSESPKASNQDSVHANLEQERRFPPKKTSSEALKQALPSAKSNK